MGDPGASGSPASSASKADVLVPFKGTLEGRITSRTPLTPPLVSTSIEATGTATELGRFTLKIPHVVNTSTMVATGTYAFTAANGDTLTASFTGQASLVAPGIISSEDTATITGGTGRFSGATGSFTIERTFVVATGAITGTFDGKISRVGARKR